MEQFTQWDLDVPGAGLYTSWDTAAGDPSETKWDLLPEIIGRTVRIVWSGVARAVAWTGAARHVRWK